MQSLLIALEFLSRLVNEHCSLIYKKVKGL